MDAPAAAQHPLLEAVDLHGAHETRHTFATWLEDAGVPARVIDELMGHQAGRRGEREGSMIGTRYRHMTEAMQARVVAVIAERLAVALAAMPRCAPSPDQGRRRRAEARRDTAVELRCCGGGAEGI